MHLTDNNNELYAHAAKVAQAETDLLLDLSTGKRVDFDRTLAPLARALDDMIKTIDARINLDPYDVHHEPTEEDINTWMEARENANGWLDQARINGVIMLSHLTAAIKLVNPSTPV